jgi:hypothetical protein
MFPTRNSLFAYIANFLIALGLFALFVAVGWIEITSTLPLWLIVLFVGLINIFSTVVVRLLEVIALPLILLIAACTLGLGIFLWTGAAMYAILLLTAKITGLFVLTSVWYEAICLGLAFALLRFKVVED